MTTACRRAAILAMVLLCASRAQAVTRHVPAEYATIQAGIDASAVGDTVLVAPGTYSDVSSGSCDQVCVCLKDGVIVRSSGGSTVTSIDMNGAPGHGVIRASGLTSELTLLEGFTITGAPFGAGGAYLYGRITIRDCRFRDLTGYHVAAGLWCRGDVTLIQCEFVNCVSTNFAGNAVYHGGGGHIAMHDCSVRQCGSRGVWFDWDLGYPIPSAHVEGCTFEDCWDSSAGSGALAISGYFNGATVRDCRFLRNHGSASQGAVGISGYGPKLVEGCLFVDNSAPGPNGGGGALSVTAPATVRGNTFYGNTCTSPQGGGAVRFSAAYDPCQLLNNVIVACAGSGAIEAYQVPLESACNVFWNNPAGVGAYYTPGPTDRIVDPLFCDVAAADFHVMAGSPCVPPGSLDCGQIGMFGEGCGTVSVDPTTWGHIKSAYRDAGRTP